MYLRPSFCPRVNLISCFTLILQLIKNRQRFPISWLLCKKGGTIIWLTSVLPMYGNIKRISLFFFGSFLRSSVSRTWFGSLVLSPRRRRRRWPVATSSCFGLSSVLTSRPGGRGRTRASPKRGMGHTSSWHGLCNSGLLYSSVMFSLEF